MANLNKTKHRNYRPEQQTCSVCHRFLKRSHIQWRKEVLFSTGMENITSWAYRCENHNCPGSQQSIVSQEAEQLHLWYRRYSRELVIKVGYRRFWLHQTMYELYEWLTQDLKLSISEREVLNVISDFLVLLRAGQTAKVKETLKGVEELVIGIDGMQPEKGNTCLYIVRELQTGVTLMAENLEDSAHSVLIQRIFTPLKQLANELGLKWRGVVSDAQESIRMAIAKSLPGTPHQVCQFHALRDAGSVIFEQDRGMKTQLKKKLRGPLGRLEQTMERLPERDAQKSVLADYALAIHTTLLQAGIPPFDLAGIQIFDALSEIAASLQRCQKKKSIPCWLVC